MEPVAQNWTNYGRGLLDEHDDYARTNQTERAAEVRQELERVASQVREHANSLQPEEPSRTLDGGAVPVGASEVAKVLTRLDGLLGTPRRRS